jgi:nitrate/nitrite-specific signal transduction histidine kinase
VKKTVFVAGEVIKNFFGGITWLIIASYFSLLIIFAALLLLNTVTPLDGPFTITVAAFLLAGFVYIIYVRVVSPFKEIVKAARAMSLGNLEYMEYRLHIYSIDELNQLAGSLKAMANSLKETLLNIRDASG